MRILFLALLLTALAARPTPGQMPPAFTPEQKEKLKERDALVHEADKLAQSGKLKEAITFLQTILKLEREILGDTHEDVDDNLRWLAVMQEGIGDFAAAKATWAEQVKLREKAHGKDHWRTIDSRLSFQNASALQPLTEKQREQLAQAKLLYQRVDALLNAGKYREAVEIADFVMRFRRELLKEQHPAYAQSVDSLARVHDVLGEYPKAEPLYLEALRIRRMVFGPKHPLFANSLNNLGTMYESQGHSAKAEPLFTAALAVYKEALGEKHGDYASGLNNLAMLYKRLGQYDKAEPLYIEAVRIRKEVLGGKHAHYSLTLNNLAAMYDSQGVAAKAEPLYLTALQLRKETLGEKHPSYGISLNNLANLYRRQGDFAKAEPLYIESVRIVKEALGEKHPLYASGLNNLATTYEAAGLSAKAEPLYLGALRITEELLGDKHPDFALTLHNLGCLYKSQKLYAKAEPLLRRAVRIQQDHLEECSAIQSEADQVRHVAISRTYLDNYLALPDANAAELYTTVFRWHGAITARQTFARLAGLSSPEVRGAIDELRDVARQMNQLAQNPPQVIAKTELVKLVKGLDDQRQGLEKKLAGRSADFSAYRTHLRQTPADLQKQLPDGTALIDFLAHGETTSAFVVTNKAIVRVVLNTSKDFDDELATFLGDLSLGRTRPVTSEDDVSAKLRTRIWEPLVPHLEGVKRVLVCPDGPLSRLPFAALPGSDPKKYLLEEIAIVMVPVPQLLTSDAKVSQGAPSLLAVGDVDFNGDPSFGEHVTKPLPVALTRSGSGLGWAALPNTKGEVELIESMFGKLPEARTKKLTRNDATETAIQRELPRHRFVHLATHGFFSPPKMVRQFQEGQEMGDAVLAPSIPPGLSSGVVCAGANKPTIQTSGVLTATQITELDLREVELAVLSACETGLGELTRGEGVFGLQRAFQIAGARSTISSLWAVDDRATAELMKRLYANRLEKGLSSAGALREAQLWVLNNGDKIGVFDQKPTGSKRTPPKFWAAFTFAGDWR